MKAYNPLTSLLNKIIDKIFSKNINFIYSNSPLSNNILNSVILAHRTDYVKNLIIKK